MHIHWQLMYFSEVSTRVWKCKYICSLMLNSCFILIIELDSESGRMITRSFTKDIYLLISFKLLCEEILKCRGVK